MSDWKVTIEVITGIGNDIEVKEYSTKSQRSAESLKRVLKLKVDKIKKMEKHLGLNEIEREVWIYPPKDSEKYLSIIEKNKRNLKTVIKGYLLGLGVNDLKNEMLDYPTFCEKYNDRFIELIAKDANDEFGFLEDYEKLIKNIVAEL